MRGPPSTLTSIINPPLPASITISYPYSSPTPPSLDRHSTKEGIREVKHDLDLMNGDEDFGFLESILRDAHDPPAPGDILGRSTMITAPTPVPAFYKLVEEQNN